MPIYAKLNENNIVKNIIVADADVIATLPDSGSYVIGEYPPETKKPRANMRMLYHTELDRFIAPQPYPSWTLNSEYMWEPPVPYPTTPGKYFWDEFNKEWVSQG